MTSSGIPKPAFYTYQLLKNISGDLLYREKNYFVVKDDRTSSTVYTIVVMNYNDEIEHLYTRSADVYKTNETINAFMDELNVDFTLPVSAGHYMIAKYAFSNQNSVFIHMAHLQFPDLYPLPEHWLQLLNTQPQTQVSIEQAGSLPSRRRSIQPSHFSIFPCTSNRIICNGQAFSQT